MWPEFSRLLELALERPESARLSWLETQVEPRSELYTHLTRVLWQRERGFDAPPALASVTAPGGDHLQPGDTVGPWRLLSRLGAGGMAEVWLADRADGAYQRQVALKLPHPHLLAGAVVERFARERDILASLIDQRIAQFYDANLASSGQPWLAMEYVDGAPIDDYCRAQRLSLSDRIALMREVARAVQAAHARLVIHRDLKPSNVLVAQSGHVKLLDFGIARLMDDPSQAGLTREAQVLATPHYAAPEQLAGDAPTTAFDVYSLGVMLFEVATGAPLKAAASPLSRHFSMPDAAPVLPSQHAPVELKRALQGELDAIVCRAMAARAADRYGTVAALADDLDAYLAGRPVAARPITAWRRIMLWARRNRLAASIAALAASILIVGVAGVVWQWQRAEEAARRAEAIQSFLTDIYRAVDTRSAADVPRSSVTVKQALDQSAGAIAGRFADDPPVQLALLSMVADLYNQLDEPAQYRHYQQQHMALAAKHYGEADPRYADAASQHAHATCANASLPACTSSVTVADAAIRAAGLGDGAIRGQWWLAEGLRRRVGGAADAGDAFAQAVLLLKREAPRSRLLVTALIEQSNHQSAVMLDYDAAVASLEQALTIAADLPKRNDAEMVTLHSNVALNRQQQGRLTEAADAFARAAELASRTVGPHARTAWSPAINSARTAHLAGQREIAQTRFAALLPHLPPIGNSPDSTVAHMYYAERLVSEGRPSAAIPILERCVQAFDVHAAYPYQALLARRFLGEAQLAAGQVQAALSMLAASLAGYEKIFATNPGGQPLLAIRESYGRALFAAGQTTAALAQYDEILVRAAGRNWSHLALAHAGRAELLARRGDAAAALAASDAAEAIWQARTGFFDVRMQARILRTRADALLASGNREAAIRVEREAVRLSLEYDDASSPTTRPRRFDAKPP